MERIEIPLPSGTRKLAGALFVPEGSGSHPGLLFIHGFRSDQLGYQTRACAVSDRCGIVGLTFDLSGHGASGGELGDLTLRDHRSDAVAAYDRLAAHPAVDPDRIGVCAASYGGYLAALLAGERAVRRLLIRAPGLYGDDRFDQPLRDHRGSDADAATTMAARNLARFGGEVLILASGADAVIPPEVITAYRQAQPRARLVTWPDAPHHLATEDLREAFLDEIIAFFSDL